MVHVKGAGTERLTRGSLAVCLVAVVVLLALPSSSSAQVPWYCFQFAQPRTPGVFATEVSCLINEARATFGLSRLRPDPHLRRAATRYTQRLVTHRLWTHSGDGTPGSRVARTGYTKGRRRWIVGEVLATVNDSSSFWAVYELFRSPAHRRVLLRRGFRDMGVGATPGQPDGDPGYTLAVELARRSQRH